MSMTLKDQLDEYGRREKIRALQCERDNERLSDELHSLDDLYSIPAHLADDDDDRVTPAAEMHRMEVERLNREMAKNDTAARVYKRRAEFASAGYLYFGDAESH